MTRLSNRQYPMLKILYDNGSNGYMSIDEAQSFDQRPFRSMLIRRWAAYRPGRGFHVTQEGKEAMHEFLTTEIVRQNPTLPLTAYFDPTAYGLSMPKRRSRPTPLKKAPSNIREFRRGVA
jgi:hypothetical protein